MPNEQYETAKSPSDSVKMLSKAAQEAGAWIIGGYELHLIFHW
jgi:omega-amidase